VYHDVNLYLYPVIKCEYGNEKVAEIQSKHLQQILQENGVLIVEEDTGELYLMMNLNGIK
jgi:hypothetical protein